MFPCLLWEPTLDIVIVATANGSGTVLKVGHSQVLQVGMIIPYCASRWQYGNEEWDFIVPPPGTKLVLQNTIGPERRPIGMDTALEVTQD